MPLKRPARNQTDRERMKKPLIIGWIIEFAGTTLWLYGYFATGSPPVMTGMLPHRRGFSSFCRTSNLKSEWRLLLPV